MDFVPHCPLRVFENQFINQFSAFMGLQLLHDSKTLFVYDLCFEENSQWHNGNFSSEQQICGSASIPFVVRKIWT